MVVVIWGRGGEKGGKDRNCGRKCRVWWRKNLQQKVKMVYHNLKNGYLVKRLHFSTNYVNKCYKKHKISY